MIAAKHEATSLGRNFQLVQCTFQVQQIGRRHLQASCHRIALARSLQHGRGGRIFLRTQSVGSFGKLRIAYGVAVALLYTCHLVVTQCVEFVIGNGRYLRLELVQLDGDVLVIQSLKGNGIGRVVDQHIGVNADLYKVDDIVVHDT